MKTITVKRFTDTPGYQWEATLKPAGKSCYGPDPHTALAKLQAAEDCAGADVTIMPDKELQPIAVRSISQGRNRRDTYAGEESKLPTPREDRMRRELAERFPAPMEVR